MNRRTFLYQSSALTVFMSLGGCTGILRRDPWSVYSPQGDIPRRTLGKTGIRVSMLGFGSHINKRLIKHQALRDRMIRLGFTGGINTFDVYDHALDVEFKQFKPMGNCIRDFRKEAVVSLVAVQSTPKMQDEINGALRDFHTDYIDLYRLYAVDDDRMNIMEKNKKEGKIRAIGVVEHEAPKIMALIDRYGDTLDFVMIIYNFHHNKAILFDNAPANDYSELIPRCKRMGLGVIGMKPMGSDAMVELAHKEGFFKDSQAKLAQAMLRYVYQAQEIDCTMPAMNSMEELTIDLESAYKPNLSPYESDMLKKLSVKASATKGAYLPRRYQWLDNWASRQV